MLKLRLKKFQILFLVMLFSLFQTTCKTGTSFISSTLVKTPVDIYASGNSFIKTTNYPVAVYWKNGIMTILSTKTLSGADSIFVSGNDVYANGYYNKDGVDGSFMGYWKNGEWIVPKSIDNSYRSEAWGLYVFGGDVYISGNNYKGSKITIPGYWKNGIWKGFKNENNISYSNISVIYVSNNDVYIGRGCGYFKNDTFVELPRFTGAKREAKVKSITVFGNDVYAGGYCVNGSSKLIAGYWKNGVWTPLIPEDSTYDSMVNSIVVYDEDIYAGGYCSKSNSSQSIAGYWKNGKWIALPQLNPESSSDVFSIVVYEGDVYAAGYSNNNSGNSVAGYWKNGVWVGLSDGNNNAEVKSIVVVPRAEPGQ